MRFVRVTGKGWEGKSALLLAVATAISAVFLAEATLPPNVVYRNDFNTRESESPIPAPDVWHTATPYRTTTGMLCCRPTTGTDDGGVTTYEQLSTSASYYLKNVYSSRPSVDGWFMPFFNYKNAYTLYTDKDNPACNVPTDGAYKLTPYQLFDSGNPCFTWVYGSATRRAGVVLHSLHNSFTNGQLRIQADMRAPECWASGYSYVRVFPVFDKYMDILAWNGSWCDRDRDTLANASITNSPATPGKFGFRSSAGKLSGAGGKRTFPQCYDVRNANGSSTQMGNNDGAGGKTTNYWFRFIFTYNLDTAHFSGSVYKLSSKNLDAGLGHPTFDTPTPSSASSTRSNLLWQNCATNAPGVLATDMATFWREKGGISGIGIDGIGGFSTLGGTITNKVLVDNIRVSWKAPEAADFDVCYENDFATRRYRTLSYPRRATIATYAPATVTTNAASSCEYPISADLERSRMVPTYQSPNSSAQPVGYDGWRVLPYEDLNGTAAGCHPGVIAYGGNAYDVGGVGGEMLTFGNQGSWGLIGQTLNATYTSGKVRLVADVRLPLGGLNTWYENTRRAAIGLGSTALYTADRDQLAANLAAGVGYLRKVETIEGVKVTNDVPYRLGASISAEKPGFVFEDDPVIPEKATWYRYDITADIGAKTYDATITPIGTASVTPSFTLTNDAIYTVTGVPFAANVTDIGSFYIRFFGYGNADAASYINRRVCVDNICVYHIEPAEEAGGEETSTLVYSNTFDKRTRSTGLDYARAAGYVADQYDRDDGPDRWIRRNITGAAGYNMTATVRDDGGNQYLAFGPSEADGTRVQISNTFGQYLKRAFRFRVDVRPPEAWGRKNGFVMFGLGSSHMEQMEIGVSAFDTARQAAFGISNTVAETIGAYYNKTMAAFAVGGEGSALVGTSSQIDPTHWYRFSATVRPELGTYSVRVFDMGATHPDCDAAGGGTFVAEQKDIPFLNEMGEEGVGSFYIHSYGARGTLDNTGMDAGNVLVDNIVVTTLPGAVLSIR